MKFFRFGIVLRLSAFVVPVASLQCVARADDASDVKATLKKIYSKRDTLYKERDLAGILAYEAPNYTEIDSKGQVREKAEADARLKEQMTKLPSTSSIKTTIEDVTTGEEGTTAKVKMVIAANITDPDGGKHKLLATVRATEVWVKNASTDEGRPAMLVIKWIAGKTTSTLDGQEMPGDNN